jgi:hypothetical protein
MIKLQYPTILQLKVCLENINNKDMVSYDKSYDAFLRYFDTKKLITDIQKMNNKNASKLKSIEQIMFLNSNNGI